MSASHERGSLGPLAMNAKAHPLIDRIWNMQNYGVIMELKDHVKVRGQEVARNEYGAAAWNDIDIFWGRVL